MYNETSDEDYGDYDDYEEEEYSDLSDMRPLEGDEKKVERQKGLNVFTPKKLLTRVPILLAQIKFGNKWCKLKNEIRQIQHLFYQHNKITKTFTTIYSSHYNHGSKCDCDKRSKNFLFQFWLILS